MECNYERQSHAWMCTFDHLLDLSFLCDFDFFSVESGASLIQLCFLGWHRLCGSRTCWCLESPPEMLKWLVVISQNDDPSSCIPRVWILGYSSWVNDHRTHSPARLWEERPIPVMMVAWEGSTPCTQCASSFVDMMKLQHWHKSHTRNSHYNACRQCGSSMLDHSGLYTHKTGNRIHEAYAHPWSHQAGR